MTFTAIDFETANASRGSACSVGICIVEDGQVTRCCERLIRPDPLYFSPLNVSIHGITASDVVHAPLFVDLWPEILANVSGPVVAHNASFDVSVIRRSLDEAAIEYPALDYFCTRVIAKLAWPGMPTYGLDHLAQQIGLSFRHHNAAEDARACALLALEVCRVLGAGTLQELEELLVCSAGCLYPGGYRPCRGRRKKPSRRQRLG